MILRGVMIEKTRMVKYRKYRQQIKKIPVKTETDAANLIPPSKTSQPLVEDKPVISPIKTTTSMTVDQIIEAHNKMLFQETAADRLKQNETVKINARWRKIGIIVIVIIAICLMIGIAAFLSREF